MPAIDNHSGSSAGLESPAENIAAITPHDTNEITHMARGIYVGGAGDVKVTTRGGTTATFVGVPAGTILPVRAKIVFAIGTSATDLVAMY